MKSFHAISGPPISGFAEIRSPTIPPFLRVHLTPQSRQHARCKSGSNDGASSSAENDNRIWKESAFPQYLQEDVTSSDFCTIWEEAKAAAGTARGMDFSLWRSIRREAETDARQEPLLSSFLYASILSHDSFERSLAFVLANRLSDATLLSTELFEVFYQVLRSHQNVVAAAMADLSAIRERDPACASYSQALLHFKGFHAIQAHRIAHCLWHDGRKVMALALQSRASEVFAVDIHPAAKIGKGVLLDHGTGVVIGETAEIGNNVSILQNVTLGGTGKQLGDRHPKVSDNVLIGASATILGNIRIGKGAQVAAGSLVLKPVPAHSMVAGSPAKEVGKVTGNPAQKMEQWSEGVTLQGLQPSQEPCVDLFTSSDVNKSAPSVGHSSSPPAAPAPAAAAMSTGERENREMNSVEKREENTASMAAHAQRIDSNGRERSSALDKPEQSVPAATKPSMDKVWERQQRDSKEAEYSDYMI